MLGISFMTSAFSLRAMMGDEISGAFNSNVTADVYVTSMASDENPNGGGGGSSMMSMVSMGIAGSSDNTGIPISMADLIKTLPDVSYATPRYKASIVLVDKNDIAISPLENQVVAQGYNSEDVDNIRSVSNIQGTMPNNKNEIALESATASETGYKIGDTVKIVYDSDVYKLKVSAIYTLDNVAMGTLNTYIDNNWARDLFSTNSNVNQILVWSTNSKATDADDLILKSAIESKLRLNYSNSNYKVETKADLIAENTLSTEQMLGFVQTFVLVFALIALFVSSFIISNTLSMLVNFRLKEYALLRALGSSPIQVYTTILIQAIILGIVGAGLGILLGVGFLNVISLGLTAAGVDIGVIPPPSVQDTVFCVIVGIIVCLIASIVPGRRAANISPIEAFAQVNPTEKSIALRGFFGLILTIIGVITLSIAGFLGSKDPDQVLSYDFLNNLDPNTALGIGAAITVVGVLIVSPLFVSVLVPPLSFILKPFNKNLLLLAKQNILSSKRRTSLTASSLIICIALVACITVVTESAKTSIDKMMDSTVKSDFFIMANGDEVSSSVIKDLRQSKDIKTVIPIYMSMLEVEGRTMPVRGADNNFWTDMIDVKHPEEYVKAFENGDAVIGEEYSKKNHLYVGDEMTVKSTIAHGKPLDYEKLQKMDPIEAAKIVNKSNFRLEKVTKKIKVGIVSDDKNIENVLVSNKSLAKLTSESQRFSPMAYIRLAPGVGLEQGRSAVEKVLKPYYIYSIMDKEQLKSMFSGILDSVLNILYAMLVLSLIISILGIVNTMSLTVSSRTREIGLLRAIGLSKPQVNVMLMFESVIISVFATVIGMIMGVFIGMKIQATEANSGLAELGVPYEMLAICLIASIIVGVISSIMPARKAKKLDILSAISFE
jgi:putative ABC transport system permease protein